MQEQAYHKLNHLVIFHPLSGFCILRKLLVDPLKLGPCFRWLEYTAQKKLLVKGTEGKEAKLGTTCSGVTNNGKCL